MDYGIYEPSQGCDIHSLELPYDPRCLKLEEEDQGETDEIEWLKEQQKAIDEGRPKPERELPKKGAREQRQ